MKTRIRRVRLRIRYRRRSDLVILAALSTLVLVTAAFLTTLAWGQKEATAAPAAPAAFTGMRKYYMTLAKFDGNEPLTACAPGYHMASLWEILDPSNLAYNTDLGREYADSAPPVGTLGWVRTGWDSSSTGDAGYANCSAWTTEADTAWGTVAGLAANWTADQEDMHVWMVGSGKCDDRIWVWCVEDYPSFVYLPLVLRD